MKGLAEAQLGDRARDQDCSAALEHRDAPHCTVDPKRSLFCSTGSPTAAPTRTLSDVLIFLRVLCQLALNLNCASHALAANERCHDSVPGILLASASADNAFRTIVSCTPRMLRRFVTHDSSTVSKLRCRTERFGSRITRVGSAAREQNRPTLFVGAAGKYSARSGLDLYVFFGQQPSLRDARTLRLGARRGANKNCSQSS